MQKFNENKEEIVKLYNEGVSINKISKKFTSSYATMHRYIAKLSDKLASCSNGSIHTISSIKEESKTEEYISTKSEQPKEEIQHNSFDEMLNADNNNVVVIEPEIPVKENNFKTDQDKSASISSPKHSEKPSIMKKSSATKDNEDFIKNINCDNVEQLKEKRSLIIQQIEYDLW